MDWKEHGVRIVHAAELDMNTPQTSGMTRTAAITHARTGAEKLWAGTMVVQPDAKTGPHHHGELETVLYVVKGRVRMRWGDHLELSEEASAGDFIYVPPYVPHQEINGSPNEICEAVVVRSGQEPVVINLDVETPEPASAGHPGMPFHCPFRKFDPSGIRSVRQNHRIIKLDACDPALARDVRRRPIQVATQARSREPISPSSTQHRIATHAASTAAAR